MAAIGTTRQADTMNSGSILVVNTGSSSLKFSLYSEEGGQERVLLDGAAQGVGLGSGKIEIRDRSGTLLHERSCCLATQGDALECALAWLRPHGGNDPVAIGHRVVHGGPRLVEHQRITPAVLSELRASIHLAPLHIPLAIDLIEKTEAAYPSTPQFACFDTEFHKSIPEISARLPIPDWLFEEGIRRYGFHGLSYESVVCELGPGLLPRTVIAHLGNGASLAAVRDGRCVDTTMSLTPAGGIPMATRSGDLDPGVLLYLLRTHGMGADALEKLLNCDSGLRALSHGRQDMRRLEEAADAGDAAAELAIDVFCRSVAKTVASYAVALHGLDLLVFSGGIGEHSARVRAGVCGALGFLGMTECSRDSLRGGMPHAATDQVRACVVPSGENLQIARHTRAMMRDCMLRERR